MTDLGQSLRACLLGHAVGDALGLPFEGLRPRRIAKLLDRRPLDMRLMLRRGMFSDDTEHHAMVAQAWLAAAGDTDRFQRSLSWRLRGWLLGLPAGIGLATGRAIIKMWLGFGRRSGVRSAGNGAAMRAPILGLLALATDRPLAPWVDAATRLTHTDPRALHGAAIVARATQQAALGADADAVWEEAFSVAGTIGGGQERDPTSLADALWTARTHFDASGGDPGAVAVALGLDRNGVSGFVVHTVPMALAIWLATPDAPADALERTIRLGGDTDTVGAIVGALATTRGGVDRLPEPWLRRASDWPRSVAWLDRLAERLAASTRGEPARPLPLFWPGLAPRNALFFAVVLAHGFRRLLPPY